MFNSGNVCGKQWMVRLGCALVSASTIATNCTAQSAPQIEHTDKSSNNEVAQPEETTEIVVKGDTKKAKGDRDVYSVDKTSTSAADALNKVPGVAVLPSGDVTLHGRHAEIYVDGHPSLLLAGDNRALALRSMPSNYIKSIEVISTPGVQYDAQGSGGIINILTNHGMPNGRFGSVSVRLNALGGEMGSLTFTENRGKFSGSFTANVNDDITDSRSSYEMTSPATGLNLRTEDAGRGRGTGLNIISNLAYNLTSQDVLKGEVNFFSNRSHSTNQGSQASTSLSISDVQQIMSSSEAEFSSPAISGSWIHYGSKPDETLWVYVSAAHQGANSVSSFVTSTADGANVDQQINKDKSATNRSEVSADYTVPIGNEQLSLGAKASTENLTSDYLSQASSLGLFVNQKHFVSRQLISAFYFNYQLEIGAKWTLLGGLRYEQTGLTMTETGSTAGSGKANYGNLTPGVFATYVFSNECKLRFSLTERLQRPNPADMLPFTEYIDPNRVRVGNPNLRPQKTTTIDAKYDNTHFGNNWGVRAFYAEDRDIISPMSFTMADPLSPGQTVVALNQANVGIRRSFGTEITFSKVLFGKVNMSGTVDMVYQDLTQVPGAPVLRDVGVGGNLVAFYSFPKGDSVSVVVTAVPRAITAVGYTKPYVMDSLSYSHALTPKLGLNVSMNNMLRMSKIRSVVETPALKSSFTLAQAAPTVMVSLNRSFGGFDLPKK
jgi:outer membrane receptor protein involved in Fe transport